MVGRRNCVKHTPKVEISASALAEQPFQIPHAGVLKTHLSRCRGNSNAWFARNNKENKKYKHTFLHLQLDLHGCKEHWLLNKRRYSRATRGLRRLFISSSLCSEITRSMQNRFLVLGPPAPLTLFKSPGLYDSMRVFLFLPLIFLW